jgi:hypothetical protein
MLIREVGKLMKTVLSEKPMTDAYETHIKDADEKLEDIGRRIAKRTPQGRHDTREKAL